MKTIGICSDHAGYELKQFVKKWLEEQGWPYKDFGTYTAESCDYPDYAQTAKGAYVIAGSDSNPDVILVASGSEVSTLVAGAELLRKDGIKLSIVSAPSEGLFRAQDKEYQETVIPANAKVFGLTAGLPVNLQGLVGANGKVFGLESFGFSAPYEVLDEKLGFTAENVYNQVKTLLA